ncbi:MAG TPA: radical SAM protein [Anaerolineae bacterium]|nr:radical SAM protein [Anaerolineae bacterium]
MSRNAALEDKLARAWQVRRAHFAAEITWSYPLDTAVLSLTGSHCALNCAHCGGHYLGGMDPIVSAEPNGATSCLISGGCDPTGRVPVTAHLDRVRAWRQGRTMNWHVGFVSEADMETIAPLVDVVSFDFVGDDETIREVYGTARTVADYVATYRLLRRYARTLPHVTIGLRGGELGHELPAFELLQELGVDGLVLLVLIPTPGTRYADRQPPSPAAVADLLAEARLRFPDVPLYLGCMRPKGRYRDALDPLAVRAGINVIVSPSRPARQLAADLGLTARSMRECCVL